MSVRVPGFGISRISRNSTTVVTRRRLKRIQVLIGLFCVVFASFGMLAIPTANAAVGINHGINFQGKLTNPNGTNLANGNYNFVFSLYSAASGGTAIWTESDTLSLTDGIFQINLGPSASGANTNFANVDFNSDSIYLGIKVGADAEMSPRVQFTATPYAFNSEKLGGITAAGFAQLNPASAQSGSLNVTGSVQAATSLQAPLVDTATAVALQIGTGTASSVTIGRTTTPFTVQGSSASTFTATNGANTTTVNFTAPTGNRSINFPDAGGTLCTTTASTCSATYQTAGSYLAKNSADTSSFAVTATNFLYGFTNSSSAVASGVLKLDNGNNTGSGLTVVGSGNPAAGQALILVNAATGVTGNLIDLQVNAASKFSVNQAGALTTASTINSQTISSTASFTGTVAVGTGLTVTTGNLAVSAGNVSASTSLIAPLHQSADTATGSTNSSALTFRSGNASGANSNSGSVTVDSGTATVTPGVVNVGTVNASAVNIGRPTAQFFVQGSAASTIAATSGSFTTNLGFTTPTAARAINFPDAGGTVCTTTASTCSATYLAATNNYLAKNAADTSSASYVGTLLGLTNNNSGAAGVLSLINSGTNSTLAVSASSNPSAGQALVMVNNTAATPSGNLIDLQNNGTSKFSVTAAGAVTEAGALTVSAGGATITGNSTITGTLGGLTGLTVASGGASISGGINNNTGNITNTGSLAGVTTIALNSTISGGTTYSASVAVQAPAFDTASAVALTVGATNATGVTIGKTGVGTTTFGINNTNDGITGVGALSNVTNIGLTGTISGGTSYTAGTSVLAPLFDTASVAPLNIGTGNASAITVGAATTPFTIQGTVASVIKGSGGGFTTTVGFTTPTAARSINFPDAGGTLCTTTASTCSGTYALNGSFLAKNAADSSSAAVVGTLLDFTNSSTGAATVLGLTNAGTNSALNVSQSGNPTSGQALIFANNSNGAPSGNLIDLRAGNVSKFSVTSAGAVTQAGSLIVSSGGINNTNGGITNTGAISGATTIALNSTISGGTTYTASVAVQAPSFDTASGVTLSVGTANASSITIGQTGITTTHSGTNQVGASAGTGALVNNGSTVNTSYAMANLATGGWDAGGAATTVDKYTYISANQTTAGQTLTIPSPTASTAYGRVLYLTNIGTASFSLLTTTIGAGSTATLIWANTNGAASWTFAGADGSGILNQSTADQTANFRISGTGRANTSFTAPLYDSISGGLNIGTTTATAISIGGAATTGTISIGTAAASTLNIGTGAFAHTIAIGTDATTVQGLTIGSNNGASATTLQAGSGNINLNAASVATNQTTVALFNSTATTVNEFAAATAINVGAANTIVTYGNGGAATLQSTTGALTITAAAASTWSATGNLTVDSSATLNLGTSAATAVSIGKTGVTTTVNGTTKVGASAGTGALLNNGSTVNTVYAMANLATGGWDAGGAAATVDIYTYISAGQTTAGQTLTIPSPTANTNYGRLLYLTNSGTASFTVLSTPLTAGASATFIWANTNGGASWTYAGADGSGIVNQNSSDQTANFRISGTGRANTSFTAPLIDSISGGLNIGTTTATGITIGGAATTGTIGIGTAAASTLNIGTGAFAHTIAIGTDATTVQGLTLGSNNSTSATTIQAGSGNINLNAASVATNQATVALFNANATTVNAFGATTSLNIGAASTVVTFGNGGAATLRSTTGALTITAAAASTWSTAAGALTVDSAAGLNLGTSTATGVSIGRSTTTTTNAGNLTTGTAGSSQLTNNGSTLNTASALGDLATGNMGASAAATVDVYTSFTISPTASGRSYTVLTPTNTAAGRVIYVSNINATNSFTLVANSSVLINPGVTATLIWNGAAWTFAGTDASSLQAAYNNSTSPEITLSTAATAGITVRDNATPIAGNLFEVQNNAGTTSFLPVTSAAAQVTGNILLSNGAARTIQVVDQPTAATVGDSLTVKSAAGNTSGNGGLLTVIAGSGGTTGIGGGVTVQGGAGGSTSGNGGLVTVQGGTATLAAGSVGGAVAVQGGTAAATAGSLGGVVTITGGAGSSTGTGAAGSSVTINGGAAGGTGNNNGGGITLSGGAATGTGTGGTVSINGGASSAIAGSAGGSININATNGTSTGTGGVGGSVLLVAGNALGTGNNNGGSIQFTAGGATGTGVPGVISIDTPVFTASSLQTYAVDSTVATSLVDANSTLLITVSATGKTITIPAPTNSTTGRIVYVTVASGSLAFTLAPTGGPTLNLTANNTATLVWNGSVWTASASSSSLQQTYNNTSSSPASIVTTSSTKTVQIKAGATFDAVGLFEVQNAAATAIFSVDSTTTTIAIGGTGNAATFTPTTGFTYTGTARHTTALRLVAEYAGAVLDADGTSNNGTMTAGIDGTNLITGKNNMHYYKWTSGQATAQDYDIVAEIVVPDDWSAWTGSPSVWTYGTASTTATVTIKDTAGTTESSFNGATLTTGTSWTERFVTASPALAGTYTRGERMLIRLHVTTPQNGDVRVGTITIPYLTRY